MYIIGLYYYRVIATGIDIAQSQQNTWIVKRSSKRVEKTFEKKKLNKRVVIIYEYQGAVKSRGGQKFECKQFEGGKI